MFVQTDSSQDKPKNLPLKIVNQEAEQPPKDNLLSDSLALTNKFMTNAVSPVNDSLLASDLQNLLNCTIPIIKPTQADFSQTMQPVQAPKKDIRSRASSKLSVIHSRFMKYQDDSDLDQPQSRPARQPERPPHRSRTQFERRRTRNHRHHRGYTQQNFYMIMSNPGAQMIQNPNII